MNSSYRFFLLACLSIPSFPLFADNIRYYAVELVLFENLDNKARGSETWPSSVELELPEDFTIEVGKPFPGKLPKGFLPSYTFKPLKRKEYLLSDQVKKINESDSRRVLLHTGWRQPGMAKDAALSVHFKRKVPAVASAQEEITAVTMETAQAEASVLPSRYADQQAGELEGLVKVILARYLHVDTDIVFRPELDVTPNNDIYAIENTDTVLEETPIVYRLKQKRRRMRSRELHYLDNPVLGMLVLITPFESKN